MNKIFEQIKEKALGWAVIFMLTTGGAFLINSGKTIIEIPETVKFLRDSRKRDSAIYMNMWVSRIRFQDSINKNHTLWLQQDFDTIRSIKWKLKRNKIR